MGIFCPRTNKKGSVEIKDKNKHCCHLFFMAVQRVHWVFPGFDLKMLAFTAAWHQGLDITTVSDC